MNALPALAYVAGALLLVGYVCRREIERWHQRWLPDIIVKITADVSGAVNSLRQLGHSLAEATAAQRRLNDASLTDDERAARAHAAAGRHLIRFTYRDGFVLCHPDGEDLSACDVDRTIESMRMSDGRMQVQGLYTQVAHGYERVHE